MKFSMHDDDLLEVFFESDEELSDISVSTDEFEPSDHTLSDASWKFIIIELRILGITSK